MTFNWWNRGPKSTPETKIDDFSLARLPRELRSEVKMLNTRRCFLKNLTTLSSSFLLFQSSPPMPGTHPKHPIDPPPPAEPEDPEQPTDNSRNAKRAQLQAQEKQFRETLAHLFTNVSDLKTQVDALHPAQVLSVAVFKQTQEIEKLARQLKNYAKS